MARSSLHLWLFLPLSLAAACGGAEKSRRSDESPLELSAGAFLARSDHTELRSSDLPPVDNPLLWRPRSIVPVRGWIQAPRGWLPSDAEASLTLYRRASGAAAIHLGWRRRVEGPAGEDTEVEILLNGIELGRSSLAPDRTDSRFDLPLAGLQSVNTVEFRFSPPPPQGTAADLPIALQRIALVGSGADRAPPPRESIEPDPDATSLVLSGSGTFVLPWSVPREGRELRLHVELEGSGPAVVGVVAFDETWREHQLARSQLANGEARDLAIGIERLAGASATLAVDVELSTRDRGVHLGDLRIDSNPALPTSPSPRGGSAGTRPDILLIILDAARGDRFPGHDYPRRVMPAIDKMAESAVVFRSAFAECPTTSCSIPGLITGISFLPGGAVSEGKTLDPELSTLAEVLRTVGYRTVGLSATPNNSASRGMDQGFDEFLELWGANNPNHGPFNMSRLATEIIESQPPDQPLFLQLHYLPPHQPYDPGPEYDRFTDPDYDGPIWPRMSLQPFNIGAASLEGADLDHLIGLYDGNLLLADAAVDQVLQTLEESGRMERTLIVLTSDHGEAFMEHGLQGHNTSLYDEMLHVPLIIRLPGGSVPQQVDTERLASLLDVAPTILGQLGLRAGDEVDGIDLIHSRAVPRRPRILFWRTSHPDQPILAARSRDWKLITWPQRGMQFLFDLRMDSGEMVNLVGERPLVYASLGLRLRQHLEKTAPRGTGGEAVELSPEALESLRSLGYIE